MRDPSPFRRIGYQGNKYSKERKMRSHVSYVMSCVEYSTFYYLFTTINIIGERVIRYK
jgi:hypothetical protein